MGGSRDEHLWLSPHPDSGEGVSNPVHMLVLIAQWCGHFLAGYSSLLGIAREDRSEFPRKIVTSYLVGMKYRAYAWRFVAVVVLKSKVEFIQTSTPT